MLDFKGCRKVMKLLIYGGHGWIGGQFVRYLKELGVPFVLGKSRVDNTAKVASELDRVKPTNVASFIGRTSGVYDGEQINTIDFLEKPGNLKLNVRDNLFGPLTLAILCKERGIHYSYLGTGCIFDYDQNHDTKTGFTEADEPNFFGSSYSIVKGYCDRLMHLFEKTVLNLRIRMPISDFDHPRNFISKIIRYPKICNIPNSMTVLSDFFPVIFDLMKRNITGTFNCTNPGVISHNQILSMYRDLVDSSFTWENFTIEEQDRVLAAKRSNNYLETEKLVEYKIPNIEDSVRKVLMRWGQSKKAEN